MNYFVVGWISEWRDGQTDKAIKGKMIKSAKKDMFG